MIDITKELIRIVKAANNLITDEFTISAKDNNGDLVTDFDYKIEKFIIDELSKNYSNYDIVSEEYNSSKGLTDNCFVIDPIDGTINFANGLPLWAIQIACVQNSKVVSAVIYAPLLNELYYADETGSYLNDRPIKVTTLPPEKTLYYSRFCEVLPIEDRLNAKRYYRNIYCASLSYAWVAKGSMGGAKLSTNHLWDYIPGQFIVEMAGGRVYNAPYNHIVGNCEEMIQLLLDSKVDSVGTYY